MTNHPREDGLLEWLRQREAACKPGTPESAEARATYGNVIREIESRGPLLDVGAVRELLNSEQVKAAAEAGHDAIYDRPENNGAADTDELIEGALEAVAAEVARLTQPEGGGTA